MNHLTIIPPTKEDKIYFTIITSVTPVVKHYLADGSKKSSANIYKGTYALQAIANLKQFDEYCKNLSKYQTIVLGLPKVVQGNLTTLKEIGEQVKTVENLIARSNRYLKYLNNQFNSTSLDYSLYLFDIDYDKTAPNNFTLQSQEEVQQIMLKIAPILRSVQMLIKPSSSSGIKNKLTGEYRSKNTSFHIYIVVANATLETVSRFTEYMKQKCYELGYYYLKKDDVGIRDKYIFDFAVAKPERLVFEATPNVEAPYIKEILPATIIDGGILDLESNVFNINLTYQENLKNEKELYRTKNKYKSKTVTTTKNTMLSSINPPKIQNIDVKTTLSKESLVNIECLKEYFSHKQKKYKIKYAMQFINAEIVKLILLFLGYEVDYNNKFKMRPDEKTASASIHTKGFIKDFGSEWVGNIVNFIAKVYDLDFKTAFEYFANLFGARHRIKMKTKMLPSDKKFQQIIYEGYNYEK